MFIAKSAQIYPFAKIIHNDNNLSIGENSQIDDFVFINAGKGCTIGRFVHISSFVSIIGGGEFFIDDFSGFSAGCRVITGSDDYSGPFLSNPTVPQEFTNYEISHVTIGKHVIVGTNTVIYPGISIGDGVTVGAGCYVRKDLKPWGIYAGAPLRKIGERNQEGIQKKALLLLEKLRLEGI